MTAETSHELQQALDGDRTETRAMLAGVARGEFDAEARLWLATVATRLLEADEEPDPRRRPGLIVAALGLAGREDHDRELLQLVQVFDSFEDLDAPKRRRGAPALIALARDQGLIATAMNDEAASRKIERLRARAREIERDEAARCSELTQVMRDLDLFDDLEANAPE